MMGSAWKRVLFARDGTLRSVWRLLLFATLFVVLLGVGTVFARLFPSAANPLLWQSVIALGAALGAGAVLLVGIDDRSPGALGFAWTAQVPRELWAGFLIGAVALALTVGAMTAAGWIHFTADEGSASLLLAVLIGDLIVLAIAAAAEEALFRGYPFQVLVQGIGPIAATLLASVVFALAHSANPNVGPLALLNIFLAGVLLSLAYLRTRSLWFATAVHLGWNWTMASALDLPVSGLAFETPLYDAVVTGPDWATGGAFGPEGGVGASVALVIAVLAVAAVPGLGITKEMRERRPLPDARMTSMEEST